MIQIAQIDDREGGTGRSLTASDPGAEPGFVNVRVDAPGERAVSITVPIQRWRAFCGAVDAHYTAEEQRLRGGRR